MRFECNVGGVEKVIRIVLGVLLIGLGLLGVFTGTVAVLGYIIGIIALVTGIVGYCPASALLGINTCRRKRAEA